MDIASLGHVCRRHPYRLWKEEQVRHLAPRQHTRAEDAGRPFYAGRRLGDVEPARVWRWLHEAPACPRRVLRDQVAETRTPITVRGRQRQRLRGLGQRQRPQGRPRQAAGRPPGGSGGALGQGTPRRSVVGVPLFAHGLDQQEPCGPVVARRQQAIAAHKRAEPADA
jgi:hypothetical protein